MFRLRHIVRRPTVEDERRFEQWNVRSNRERYLAANPLERYASDVAYREKVDRIRAGLNGLTGVILDLGGNTAGEATILVQQGFRVVVGDINEVALDISRTRALRFGLQMPDYVALDVHELPFKSEAFSAVTVVEALHHFRNYRQALHEIHRVLKPGGTLLAFEPNARNPIRRLSELRDRLRGSIEKSFSRRQLLALCSTAGFDGVAIDSMPSRRSGWNIDRVPAYRRPLARLHASLGEAFPAWFGIWKVQARKSGRPSSEDDSRVDVRQLLRSPGDRHELRFDAEQGVWIEEHGSLMFPDLNGIPVLIGSNASRVGQTTRSRRAEAIAANRSSSA